jgi:hypothetical protein
MPSYRIHRLKRHLQQQFSVAPHVSGTANIKPRDYEPGPEVSQNPFLVATDEAALDVAATEAKPTNHRTSASRIQRLPPELIEAPSPYGAYFALREEGRNLTPGDVLEAENGSLRIFKYVGFEEAQWVFAEPKSPSVHGASASATETLPERVLERGMTA